MVSERSGYRDLRPIGRTKMKKLSSLLCLSLVVASSQAYLAFNTFGAGESAKVQGWGFGDIKDTRIAAQFTASKTGVLNFIKMKMQKSGDGKRHFATISLFEDNGNDIGTLMATFTVDLRTAGVKTFTNNDRGVRLIGGRKYWIEAKAAAGSTVYSGWNENDQGRTGLIKFGQVEAKPNSTYRVGGGALPAFSVDVIARPWGRTP